MLSETELLNTQGTAVVIEDDLDIRNLVCACCAEPGSTCAQMRQGATG
ncbi:hypothetical protein IWX65_000697 [Arthrobacter sp. CAN_A214]